MIKRTNDITVILAEVKPILQTILFILLTSINLTIVLGLTFSDMVAFNSFCKVSVKFANIVTGT